MPSLSKSYGVVIIGGGMVGASLACLLAETLRDESVALIESQPLDFSSAQTQSDSVKYLPSFDARSTALSRSSIKIFQRLDIWSKLSQRSTAIKRVHISDRRHIGGSVIDGRDYIDSDMSSVGAVVENATLGAVLLQRLEYCQKHFSNLTCIAPARVERLQANKQGYKLQLVAANESRILQASLCIICDGAQSSLRASLGIEADIFDYQQRALVANVELSESHQGIAYERFTAKGPMALLPLGEASDAKMAALVWTLAHTEADEISVLSDADFLQRLQQHFGTRLGQFLRVGRRHDYPLQLITAREQVRSHLVLMGNAAHFLHPVAGQGFNLALRDCDALCHVLKQGKRAGETLGSLSVLQQYLQRQNFDQQATIQLSDNMVKLFSTSALPQTILRALGFVGLELLPPAKKYLAQQAMGVG